MPRPLVVTVFRLALPSCLLPSFAPLLAQLPAWTQVAAGTAPSGNPGYALAADSQRGCVVLFGGRYENGSLGDTWEWDGEVWNRRSSLATPAGRSDHALAYDSQRGCVVLFGGRYGNNSSLGDTWEWDGSNWTLLNPTRSPYLRYGHAMVFDRLRGRTFLFGGNGGSDAWEWDGGTWTLILSAHAPTPRAGLAMAYDGRRARTVLFGGGQNAETWEWDGTDWTPHFPVHAPPARSGHTMAYDIQRARTVMHGGAGAVTLDDTWLWDGVDWTDVSPAGLTPGPTGRLAIDEVTGAGVLLGTGTWLWDGTGFTRSTTALGPHGFAAMASDDRRGRTVMFGGQPTWDLVATNETWERGDAGWILQLPATSPPPRDSTVLVFDSQRRRSVMFGGRRYPNPLGDTWEWDGSDWTQRTPAVSPPPRMWHSMAYDRWRGRTVLFGGASGSEFADTWEWDGANWSQLPVAGPPARAFAAMAFDNFRGRTVLFGGLVGMLTGSTGLADTWEWDGVSWSQQAPSPTPGARYASGMAFDEARRQVVLVGDDAVWQWDGTYWSFVGQPWPRPVYGGPMAYHAQRGRIVTFDALDGSTWEYQLPGLAVAQPFGSGCGAPALTAAPTSRPVLGQVQAIEVANAPAGVAFMAYGWSNARLGAFALPLDLAPFGLSGCELLQSIDLLAEPCPSTGPTSAQHTVLIPNLPWLLGAHVWLQAWAPAPGANAAGTIVSNGVSLLLGST